MTFRRTRTIRAWLDGLLGDRFAVETARKLGTLDTTAHSLLLLETLAKCSHTYSESACNERPTQTSDPARQELQGSLAYGQDDRERRWYDERLVSRTGFFESQDLMGRTCSSTLNRRMRTRTYGCVGRVVSNDHPYPI